MKALVLCGGAGTRLRPFSHSMPKQLIPVANKPVLAHILESLRRVGVTEIAVIVGEHVAQIRETLQSGPPLGVAIRYIRQDAPRGLAHCVQIAREFLGDDDFVMYLGDNMLTDGIDGFAEEFRSARPAAQVVVHKVANPQAFGVVEVDSEGKAVRFVEKPQQPRSDLAVVGVYFFTAAIHAAIAAIRPGRRGELEITDALQQLVEQRHDVRVRLYQGFWKDTGRPEDVLECNRELLAAIRPASRGEVDDDSELVGPVIVEAGTRIIRSRIVGPAIIGADALLVDSQVGPYTSIGDGCVLDGAGVEYSIALAGATVRRVGGIHSSIIGRGATVTSAPDGRHRLLVGDHSNVEVKG